MMLSRKKGKKERAKMMAAVETIKGQSSSSSSSGPVMSQEDEDRIKTQAEVDGIECPADREELGRQSWTLLHTMAAYYPKKPSSSQKTMAGQFLHSLSHLYPCKHCSHYLRESMKTNPPRLESRDSFSIWMCEQHNEVNKRLGKKEFDCEIGEIYKRWRVGDPQDTILHSPRTQSSSPLSYQDPDDSPSPFMYPRNVMSFHEKSTRTRHFITSLHQFPLSRVSSMLSCTSQR